MKKFKFILRTIRIVFYVMVLLLVVFFVALIINPDSAIKVIDLIRDWLFATY